MFKRRKTEIDPARLPLHIGIIMDGNGRWARRRGLPRSAGHSAGSSNFKTIARYCNQIGIQYLTVYAFSTENWKRPQKEIDGIMNLLRDYLKDSANFKEENIRLRFIGELSVLPQDIIDLIATAQEDSKAATGLVVNLALNYGGRDEIVHAARSLAQKAAAGELEAGVITEQMMSEAMYTAGQPDPDLIIRPSGEMRLSNFLIWQAAYSEFWFSDVLWPDFKPKHLDEAIAAYQTRSRRFGDVKPAQEGTKAL